MTLLCKYLCATVWKKITHEDTKTPLRWPKVTIQSRCQAGFLRNKINLPGRFPICISGRFCIKYCCTSLWNLPDRFPISLAGSSQIWQVLHYVHYLQLSGRVLYNMAGFFKYVRFLYKDLQNLPKPNLLRGMQFCKHEKYTTQVNSAFG